MNGWSLGCGAESRVGIPLFLPPWGGTGGARLWTWDLGPWTSMSTRLDRVEVPHRRDVEHALGDDRRAVEFCGELHFLENLPNLVPRDLLHRLLVLLERELFPLDL